MNEKIFSEKRKSLVKEMSDSGFLKSAEIKGAFLAVKREAFFPKEFENFAYSDEAFPIGFGQTISQPSTIAIMLEMLSPEKGMKILEIGAGSAYVIALLAQIVGQQGKVFGIELLPELKSLAEKNLKEAQCKNFELLLGNGCNGWREKKPFDRILISAACSEIPKALSTQLKENGKIVAPIGGSFSQELVLFQEENGVLAEKQRKCCFVFVPLKC